MLSETSYLTAIYCYTGAAGVMLLYLCWWLSRHWSGAWVVFAVLLAAALLLTPAYPQPGATTMAPALIVAGFQLLTEGPETALSTLQPMALFCGLAVVLAVLLRLLIFRPARGAASAEPEQAVASAGEPAGGEAE